MNVVQDVYRAGPGDIVLLFLGFCASELKCMFYSAAELLEICCRSATEILQICCCPVTEVLNNRFYIPNLKSVSLCFTELQKCCRPAAGQLQGDCRDSADLLLPCCRGTAVTPIDLTYQI